MPFIAMQTDMYHPNKQLGGQLVVHQPLSCTASPATGNSLARKMYFVVNILLTSSRIAFQNLI